MYRYIVVDMYLRHTGPTWYVYGERILCVKDGSYTESVYDRRISVHAGVAAEQQCVCVYDYDWLLVAMMIFHASLAIGKHARREMVWYGGETLCIRSSARWVPLIVATNGQCNGQKRQKKRKRERNEDIETKRGYITFTYGEILAR